MPARSETSPPASASRRSLEPAQFLRFLLIFVPIAAVAAWMHANPVLVFACAALAIVPLAGLMGEATESLAARAGAGVGALLNATFGNAAELIIALVALQRGLHDVVKASITGSIIGNGLLVLGLAVLAGGIGRERQTFNRSAAGTGSTLLALAAIGLLLPAAFHWVASAAGGASAISFSRRVSVEHAFSLEIAIVLFVVYVLSLLFTLRTHRHQYAGDALPAHAGPHSTSFQRAVLTLLIATVLIAGMSELLVGTVEAVSHRFGFTEVFVGVIVVAIIGNAAEHSTAVLMAMRNQMDLALNIAIGSSIQIALFVAPIVIFASYALGPRPMDFLFTPFEVMAVLITVWVVHMVSQDGETHWLEGVMLVAVYVLIGLAFFALPG